MNDTKTEQLLGEGIQLGGLLDYQQGSVVSRTIIKNPAGTVTLFAFDQGEGLSEHTAPFDAMVHIVDGAAKITVSGNPYNLKAGDVIVMPRNEPHALHASERFKMLLVMIKG
jgi:quercetin dioxygenase-like cupin family protein